jgi:DNA-binding response OmpR family regulator
MSDSKVNVIAQESAPGTHTLLPKKRKILLVDDEPERRKQRIAILKERGFAVYPALAIEQAHTRCRPGAYNLIIVNANNRNKDMALELCDQIRRNDPKQLLLLMMAPDVRFPHRDYLVSHAPKELLERVESLFHQDASTDPEAVAA